MTRGSRLIGFVAVAVAMTLTFPAFALCRRHVTSYWAYVYPDATSCNPVIWPVQDPEVVGEVITECDGSQWSWGDTSCTYVPPTTESEPCPPPCWDRDMSVEGGDPTGGEKKLHDVKATGTGCSVR